MKEIRNYKVLPMLCNDKGIITIKNLTGLMLDLAFRQAARLEENLSEMDQKVWLLYSWDIELEEKIKALENDDATMDDLLAVEKELKNATAVTGTSQPVQGTTTTTTTTTTPVSGTTTTTTPVTTTKQVPTTVNPGSIVRTGIKSLVGVAVVLVVALGAFALTGKNKKNQNEKTQRRDNDEIK